MEVKENMGPIHNPFVNLGNSNRNSKNKMLNIQLRDYRVIKINGHSSITYG